MICVALVTSSNCIVIIVTACYCNVLCMLSCLHVSNPFGGSSGVLFLCYLIARSYFSCILLHVFMHVCMLVVL